ncbi:unnamed protein product [Closterium sp. NIES-65]|nr:unnamed protein product [Closterium sp. NIES-65]
MSAEKLVDLIGAPHAIVRPLVSQHVGVWFEPSGETAVCVDGDSYQPLATFTAEPGSSLYTLRTGPRAPQQQPQQQQQPQPQQQQQQQQQLHQRSHQQPPLLPLPPVPPPVRVPASHQVASSPQVSVSCQVPTSAPVAASCSCRSLAHPTVLWHHRMGHPSLPRLPAMSSQRLVLGLPRVLPSLPPSLAPPCGPCVEGRLRAAPHSSSLRPATEPFETLHLDVWGPAPRLGPERERYFLVVVDDFSRYTTVFPLAKKSEVTSTLIRWFLTTEDTRGRRVSCLHSDRGGEFRSGILAGFCREQGIRQSWTLPESPQQNGVAERRIGLVRRAPAEPLATCLSTRGFTDQSLDRVPWCCVAVSCLGVLGSCPRHLRGQALASCRPLCLPWFP